MLVTFMTSGRLIARWGRYKVFPIVGTALTAVGLWLLTLLTPSTTLLESSLAMVVLGLGIGSVMQVLVVAGQNAVEYRQLGTATSVATFFRSIGGACGVALLGAIFNNRLFEELPKYLPSTLIHQFAGHNISSNPAQIDALPPAIRHGYVEAFSHSLQSVFLIGVPIALFAFACTWLLREVPLRDFAPVDVDGTLTDKGKDLAAGRSVEDIVAADGTVGDSRSSGGIIPFETG